MMMKNIFTSACLCLTISAFAQDNKKDTTQLYDYGMRIYDARIGRYMSTDSNSSKPYQNTKPEVSVTVIKAVEKSACDCMSKLDIKKFTTPEQKKQAMNNCLVQATTENEAVMTADKNAQPDKGYDAGKKYGLALGKKLGQLLKSNCPAFVLLGK
jgi:hypothetical protein